MAQMNNIQFSESTSFCLWMPVLSAARKIGKHWRQTWILLVSELEKCVTFSRNSDTTDPNTEKPFFPLFRNCLPNNAASFTHSLFLRRRNYQHESWVRLATIPLTYRDPTYTSQNTWILPTSPPEKKKAGPTSANSNTQVFVRHGSDIRQLTPASLNGLSCPPDPERKRPRQTARLRRRPSNLSFVEHPERPRRRWYPAWPSNGSCSAGSRQKRLL